MNRCLKSWTRRWSKRIIDSVSCFLREPLRAVAAAGLVFGIVFCAMVGVLIASMFISTSPLAASVVVPLAWLAGAILGLIAIITVIQLGFDKIALSLPNGINITAEYARNQVVEGLGEAQDGLDAIATAVGADEHQ